MDKNKAQTFFLSVDDFGQKICTSQSEPQKKYVLDDEGNMSEYQPETSIRAIKFESQGFTEDSNSSLLSETNEVVQLEDDSTPLGIMSSLDEVSAFEENLMKELDSDFMKMVPNPQSQLISQHMEITEPIKKLRTLVENRLGVNLKPYSLALQGQVIADENTNLVEQCVQRAGLVQIHIQLQPSLKCINIVDVLEPAEGYVHKEDHTEKSEKRDEPSEIKKLDKYRGQYAQWQVDVNYKREQERLKIPSDPMDWSAVHVRHWVQWAVRQFNLTNIKLSDWSITGKELYEMSIHDFQKIAPNDPGDVFWTHLELLRKMKVVATTREEPVEEKSPKSLRPKVSTAKKDVNYATTVRCFDATTYSPSGNRSGNNGQIQLWQFLLELLTSKEYSSIIQWMGKEGEFKLNHPDVVAQLWGERKNKPTMNYEKLSRALRYYYDGDMISKVSGKRFVYKFVCDLKQLVGYSAIELANLVKYANPLGDVEYGKKEAGNRKENS